MGEGSQSGEGTAGPGTAAPAQPDECTAGNEPRAVSYDELLTLVHHTYVSKLGPGGHVYFSSYLAPVASTLRQNGEADEVAMAGLLRDILAQRLSSRAQLEERHVPERTIALVEILTQVRGAAYLDHLRDRIVPAGPDACLVEHTRLGVNLAVLRESGPLDVGVSLRKQAEYTEGLELLAAALPDKKPDPATH